MADDWIGINSSHIDGEVGVGYCGEFSIYTLAKALDGTGRWNCLTNHTHWFILDLGETYTIKKVRGRSNSYDDPIDVDIFVSDDKENWGDAVATGISTWQDTAEWQEVDTVDKDGRYIKVVINDTEDANSKINLYAFASSNYHPVFDAYGSVAGGVYYHGLKVQGVGELALCDVGTHPLRIRKGGTTYGIELVATDDPNASVIRIKTGAGIKAIRKYT